MNAAQNIPSPKIPEQNKRSLVVIECGSVWTKAFLFGPSEGRFHILAKAETYSTYGAPFYNIIAGARAALHEITNKTGKQFIDHGLPIVPETEFGEGADGIAVVISGAIDVRMTLLGPGSQQIKNRITSTGLNLPVEITIFNNSKLAEVMSGICVWNPHGVLIATSLERPMTPEEQQVLESELKMLQSIFEMSSYRPAVILLGYQEDAMKIRAAFPNFEFTFINARNSIHQPLHDSILSLYENKVLPSMNGYANIRSWVSAPPISEVSSLGRITRFIAQRYELNTLVISVGATAATAAYATSSGALIAKSNPLSGVRMGAGAVLRKEGAQRLAGMLSEEKTSEQMLEAALRRMLHPWTVPAEQEDLEMDHALAVGAARGIVREIGAEAQYADIIIGSGGVFAHIPTYAEAALMLIDAAQPTGVTNLLLDRANMFAALGGASLLDRLAAADVVDIDVFVIQLGVCVTAIGTPPAGAAAVEAQIEYEDGRVFAKSAPEGTITKLPLGQGQRAYLTLKPSPGVDVGQGPGKAARTENPIEGGYAGVIIDTRGQKQDKATDLLDYIAQRKLWLQTLAAQ